MILVENHHFAPQHAIFGLDILDNVPNSFRYSWLPLTVQLPTPYILSCPCLYSLTPTHQPSIFNSDTRPLT